MLSSSTFSFVLSALLHISVLLFLFFGIADPFRKVDVEDNTLVVEFAQIAPQTASPVMAPPSDPEKGGAKKPDVEPTEQKIMNGDELSQEQKEHKNQELQEEFLNLQKKQMENDLQKKLKKEKQEQNEKEDKKKKELEKKKELDKKKEKKKKEEQKIQGKKRAQMNLEHKDKKDQAGKKKKSLDDLFDDLESKDSDKPSKKAGQESKNRADTFTASEISILKSHISKCWNIHSGAMGAKDHVVDVEIHINADGNVKSAEVMDKARMKADPFYRVAAEAAQRSVLDPDCNPLPIPASSYEKWKVIRFRFDPKDMF